MSNIKRLLHSYEDVHETTPSLDELLDWLDLNGELFQHLPHPEPSDMIGYEEF